MCTREDFGVLDVLRAADIVSCLCAKDGCELPPAPRIEDIVRWQSEPSEAKADTE